MRQIVLDTETTGIDPQQGHKLIEIGCIEIVNRKLTGNHYHQYINPQRDIEQEAFEVHGISTEFLADKPLFADIAEEFIEFVKGAELIIHNAPFDIGFLDHEISISGLHYGKMQDHCKIIDTLVMAKNMHPGQRNSLDALCKRYAVDNSHRELHGALLDSEILAEVYLLMTGGQTGLALGGNNQSSGESYVETVKAVSDASQLPVLAASPEENRNHEAYLDMLEEKTGGHCQWRQSSH